MSLTFAISTSSRVDCGSGTSLDDLTALTVLMWIYPTTLASGKALITKRGGWRIRLNDASGNFYFIWDRTADLDYTTNSAPLTANQWNFVAASITQTGPAAHLYVGGLSAVATEATYGTSSAGSGAFVADAAYALILGNRDNGSGVYADSFQGRIGPVMLCNTALSLGEIVSWQFRPRMLPSTVGYWNLGDNGTGTQPDLSGKGNAGTLAGSSTPTQSDNPPLPSRRRAALATPTYTAPAAPTGAPLWIFHTW